MFRTQSIAQTLALMDQDGHFSRDSSARPKSKSGDLKSLVSRTGRSKSPLPAAKSSPALPIYTVPESTVECDTCSLLPPSSRTATFEATSSPASQSERKEETDLATAGQSQQPGPSEADSAADEHVSTPSSSSKAVKQPADPSSAVPETSSSANGTVSLFSRLKSSACNKGPEDH